MKKKLLCVLLAAFSVLSLSACGEAPDYYFKDDVLIATFSNVTITKWDVIPVGGPGNEKGTAPVIAFWYYATRTCDKIGTTPYRAWSNYFSAKQTNALKAASIPDDAYRSTQSESMKVGETIPCAFAYYLESETEPVTLSATCGSDKKKIGQQSFDIASKISKTTVSTGQDMVDKMSSILKENGYPDITETSNVVNNGRTTRFFRVDGTETSISMNFTGEGKTDNVNVIVITSNFSNITNNKIYYMLRYAVNVELVPKEILKAADLEMEKQATEESMISYNEAGYSFHETYDRTNDKMAYSLTITE